MLGSKKELCDYALTFLGTPYIYGGSTPQGIDCSGLIVESLTAFGILHGDFTALGLYKYLSGNTPAKKIKREQVKEGDLIFYGRSLDNITHVALALNNTQMLESGGGDRSTLTIEEAIKKSAFVRIRPIDNRADIVAILEIS